MILPLGSGDVALKGCGSKAASLDRAARAGLPVPPGVVILDEAWHWAIYRNLIRVGAPSQRRPVSVPDPSLLVHLLRLPALSGPLAVRAAFTCEDGAASPADGYVPGLFVDNRRPAALAAGLAGVWAAVVERPRDFRRNLILQEMVGAHCAGMALTQREYEDDLFDATDGTVDHLVAGKIQGERRTIPKRRGREGPTKRDPVEGRLQVLLRDVRRVFGEGDWEVEWADDGKRLWIIQIRPLSQPPRRDDVFTAAPHRELAPEPSSRLMTSLISTCEPGLLHMLRRFDPALPAERPLVEVFLGRPFLNLSLLNDVARRWGLPSRLVSDSIGGGQDGEFAAQPRRLLAHGLPLARLFRAQLRPAHRARQASERILERTASLPSQLTDLVEELRWVYGTLASETLRSTAALCGPLAVLRRAGVLTEVAERWRSDGKTSTDDVPALRALAAPSSAPPSAEPPSARARLLRPVVGLAEGILEARGELRTGAATGFERIHGALLAHGRALVAEGLLPSAEAIFHLDIGEVHRIRESPRPDSTFWQARESEVDSVQPRNSATTESRSPKKPAPRPGSAKSSRPGASPDAWTTLRAPRGLRRSLPSRRARRENTRATDE